jgi:hypothetical protein
MPGRATVRSAVAPLLHEGRAAASQVSQLLRGHPADLLDRAGDWVRLRGADGYEGWCHAGYLIIDPGAGAEPLRPAWSDERRMSLGCTVRTPMGSFATLPLGAFLDPDEAVAAGLAMNHRGRARYFAPQGELLVQRTIQLYSGTPYLWGGVTPWGADCSGVVQTMFALSGIQLPRDAWQQAEVGTRLEDETGDLRPGDLLFFSDRDDGRITHVAISRGGAAMVHSSLANGGFGTNSLDGRDTVSTRLRATFQFATRVL